MIKERARISLDVSPELAKKLKAESDAKDITLNATIRLILQQYFEEKMDSDKERIRRFYKNLKEAKKRRNKYKKKSKSEKAVNLYNTFSFVSNKWESFDKVTKLNIYQLFDVYNFLNADINFHFDMGIACSGWADKNFRIRDIRLETVK